jgi:hypothetical protein
MISSYRMPASELDRDGAVGEQAIMKAIRLPESLHSRERVRLDRSSSLGFNRSKPARGPWSRPRSLTLRLSGAHTFKGCLSRG